MLRAACLLFLASPTSAQERVLDMELVEQCATVEIGAAECPALDLAESLGLLSGTEMRPFGNAGMESFAMLTALRYAASALFFREEGDGCVAEEERTAAIEIWSLWVRLPDDAPGPIASRFGTYDGIMSQIVELDLAC
ncbi:MAG: hypothetical protein AAGA32_03240 [Pseudomonadota bacterium]